MANKRLKLILMILLLLESFLFGEAWASNGKSDITGKIPVKVMKVEKRNLASSLSLMGAINYLSKADVSSETSGVLESVKVEEGNQVHEGEVVAVIDSTLLRTQLKQYQASLELAKIDLLKSDNEVKKAEVKVTSSLVSYEKTKQFFETQEKLFRIGGIIQSDLDDAEIKYKKAWADHQLATEELKTLLVKSEEGRKEAEAKVKKAEADLEEIQVKIQKSTIKAPISGIVSVKKKYSGETVAPNDALILTLIEIDHVYAEVDLNEKNMALVSVGQSSKVVSDAYPDHPFVGKVYSLSPVVDSNSRTLKVKIKVANPKGLLKPGMFTRVEIMEMGRAKVLAIPEEALTKTKDGKIHIFVIIDEIAFLRTVETGTRKEGWVAITKGLKPGEKVVLEGQERLRDLASVQSTEITR
ncbi:MAG: efflux RND transporter periplasmic adaptor subunit [Deltaproteobacteria bacterium]|nr:efflux RND transporter periplasmic adaptor subunit [Deltaproteobacteria bacterium]